MDKKHTKFKPSPDQIALLKAWASPEQKPTITAICETVGISRTTYYKWFADDEFVNWFNEQWDIAMAKTKPYLDNVGLKKAVSDFRYWEAMQMKYHKFKRQEESTGEQTIRIIYNEPE